MNSRRSLYLLLALASVATPALSTVDPQQQCDRAAAAAAQKTGVPIDILLAITRVETGRSSGGEPQPWPWTINADGTGSWFATKAEAVESATAHLNDGTTNFDIGCFQLNMHWHGANFASVSDMFDPQLNADYAARFLLRLYQENGDWAQAVAAYHSRSGDLGEAYLDRVKAVLNGPTAETEPAPATPRENLFPLLQAGERGAVGSIVPLQSAHSRLIGG